MKKETVLYKKLEDKTVKENALSLNPVPAGAGRELMRVEAYIR
jgi:hypothetical protein